MPLRICLRGEDSGGRLAVVEMALDPASGPPLRLPPTHGEGFYVLAGKLTLQLGEEIVTGGPGTRAFAPPDIPPERSAAEQETRSRHLVLPATTSVPLVVKLLDAPYRPAAFVVGARAAAVRPSGPIPALPPAGDDDKEVNSVQDAPAAAS